MWEISIRVLFNIKHVRNIYTDPNKRDALVPMWREVIKKMFGLSRHNFTCVAYGPAQKFLDALPSGYYKKLVAIFEEIKLDFQVGICINITRTKMHVWLPFFCATKTQGIVFLFPQLFFYGMESDKLYFIQNI